MIKQGLAVAVGLVLAMAAIMGIELLSAQLFPIPGNFMAMDSVDQGAVMDELPFAAKALVVFGWGLGSFVGALAVRWIAGPGWLGLAVVALVILGGLVNVFTIPHPLWMRAGAVIAPLIGYWLAGLVPVASGTLRWRWRAAG
ncbi:MAG: hypothetical protein A4S12_08005 [Proteobacteria bacterium SG_bin5]|nr:hypothetical protein [Sphingomonas sp.]OQW41518.1 MAG: hypothetical protein A4S12_08005 [Proteobacteria bacterium SG_bin5]